MGEMCPDLSTPYGLQVWHDITKSHSIPPTLYASSQAPYPPRSPVPPLVPNYPYRYPVRLPHIVVKQGNGGDSVPFEVVNEVHEPYLVPRISNSSVVPPGAVGGDPPPSYIEAVSPTGSGPLLGNVAHVNPMIPKFSALNIQSESQQSVNHPSKYSDSDSCYQDSSFSTKTMHNAGQCDPHNHNPLQETAAAARKSPYIPTVIPNSQVNGNNGFVPLLTELGQPTAASKKTIFDDDDDDDD